MMYPSLRQFLLTPPQSLDQAQTWGLPLAHMAYQLDETGQLCQAPLPPHGKGGLMLVGVPTSPAGQCDPRRAVRDILTVCQGRGFGGVILDLEQPPTRFLSQLICGLEEGLTQRKRTLFLPESYGNYSDRASIYLTSAHLRRFFAAAVGGGHRHLRPPPAGSRLRRARDDFFLPSVKGQGRPISQETLERLQRRLNPSVFFSPDLCAHYFTYMSRETGAHFILFDDGESLEKKRTLAQELGISRFFPALSRDRGIPAQAGPPGGLSIRRLSGADAGFPRGVRHEKTLSGHNRTGFSSY